MDVPAPAPSVRRPDSNHMEDMPVPYRDPEKALEHDRERYRRLTKERLVQGLCPKCGREPLPPERGLCRSCGEKKRKAERARYARAKAEGRLYGGRNPEDRRRIGRGEKQEAPPDTSRRRPVHAMREPSSRPGRGDLPGLP